MTNIKKIVLILGTAIIIILLAFLVGSGFTTKNNVVLSGYIISDDKTELTLNITLPSSIGYVRDIKDKNDNGYHYIDFYSTFGGLNNPFGSKTQFTLNVTENDSRIYFARPNGEYELVLMKDGDTGEWTNH